MNASLKTEQTLAHFTVTPAEITNSPDSTHHPENGRSLHDHVPQCSRPHR